MFSLFRKRNRMALHSISELPEDKISGRRFTLRADMDVPRSENGLGSLVRLEEACRTIHHITNRGGSVCLIGHWERPGGKRQEDVSLSRLVAKLNDLLGVRCAVFLGDVTNPKARELATMLAPTQVGVMENLRFDPREENKDADSRRELGRILATLGDAYVFDAIGVSHRKHASVYEAVKMSGEAYGGLTFCEELNHVRAMLDPHGGPLLGIIAGAKADKLAILEGLVPKCSCLAIAGLLTIPFLRGQGVDLGRHESKFTAEDYEYAARIAAQAESSGCKLLLPVDWISVDPALPVSPAPSVPLTTEAAFKLPYLPGDIGPQSAANIVSEAKRSQRVCWNGTPGIYEDKRYEEGTEFLARFLSNRQCTKVYVCGGNTTDAVGRFQPDGKYEHCFTAGGAILTALEKGVDSLPAVEAFM